MQHEPNPSIEKMRDVAEPIPTKDLVAAVAAEGYRHVGARQGRNVLGRHGRRVGKRLVERCRYGVQDGTETWLNLFRVMTRPKVRGGQARGLELVLGAASEPHRPGPD